MLWPFKVVVDINDKPMIVVKYKGQKKHLYAEEVSYMVFTYMREIAEAPLEKLLLMLLHMVLTRGLIALKSKTFSSLTLVVVLLTIKDKLFQDKATA
ncbi:hypothetical protein JHK85_056715 [Glycine max]|nr:hypothetical protein JHK85_056715 [Glycine max]